MNLVNQTIDGKYRMREEIGRGGMGSVYAAEHVGTGRPVAVKVILPRFFGHPEALERFRREARAAGGLRHPNIVDVTDFGVTQVGDREIAYLVMEHLQGTTLRSLIEQKGALPVEVVAAIVEQIALALDEAHGRGLIHRDLKPDNVWLVPDARGGYIVRVLDFGLAKLLHDVHPEAELVPQTVVEDQTATMARYSDVAPASPNNTPTFAISAIASDSFTRDLTAPLTMAGSTLGTPAYMSPEQCRGSGVNARSDIYSLGVLTYEALCGRRPFDGNVQQLIDKHLHHVPDRLATVSTSIGNVVARALEKDPALRFPSARAMAGSLLAATEEASVIIRRAVSLYADRLDTFLALSARVSAPSVALVLVLAVIALWIGVAAAPLVMFASVICWMPITSMTNAAFAVAIDRLRSRPLEALHPVDVVAQMKRRLGLSETSSVLTLSLHLLVFYVRCELKAKAGAGDLAFLIAFLEGIPPDQAAARCTELAKGPKKSYNWVRGGILLALFTVPIVEGCILFSLARLLRLHNPAAIAVILACALIPVNAMLINPVFSSALALLYFRARQANGEDVELARL